jgi:hypothetical protein
MAKLGISNTFMLKKTAFLGYCLMGGICLGIAAGLNRGYQDSWILEGFFLVALLVLFLFSLFSWRIRMGELP